MKDKRKKMILLIMAFLCVLAIAVIFLAHISLSMRPPPAIHVGDSPTSPNGHFIASVEERPHPTYEITTIWVLVIRNSEGNVLYEDEEGFVRTLLNSVYWRWDEANRIWLHNGDDGRLWFWEIQNGEWTKNPFESGAYQSIHPPSPFD